MRLLFGNKCINNLPCTCRIMLLLAVCLLFFAGSCKPAERNNAPTPAASPVSSESPGQDNLPTGTPSPSGENSDDPIHFKTTKLQSRDGNKKNWVLNSKAVKYDEKAQTAEAEEVTVAFYDTDGKEVLKLTASGASVNLKEKMLVFKGAVHARSEDGEELYIKELSWDGNKKKLLGKNGIRLVRKTATMTSRELEADPELRDVVLSGDVKIEYPDMDNFLGF